MCDDKGLFRLWWWRIHAQTINHCRIYALVVWRQVHFSVRSVTHIVNNRPLYIVCPRLFIKQADRGCARSQLLLNMCSSKEDGMYYNQFSWYFTTLYSMIHHKRGGTQGLRIKRARDDYVGYLILRKPHYCWGTKMTALLISPVLHRRSATTTIVTISRQIIIIFWIG